MNGEIRNKVERIRQACEQRLAQTYPAGIPGEIAARYEKEIAFLEVSNHVEQFDLYRLLANAAHENGFSMYGRGTLMGSLLYFLLGHGSFLRKAWIVRSLSQQWKCSERDGFRIP